MMYTVHNTFNNLYVSFQTVLIAGEKYGKELGQGKEKNVNIKNIN